MNSTLKANGTFEKKRREFIIVSDDLQLTSKVSLSVFNRSCSSTSNAKIAYLLSFFCVHR